MEKRWLLFSLLKKNVRGGSLGKSQSRGMGREWESVGSAGSRVQQQGRRHRSGVVRAGLGHSTTLPAVGWSLNERGQVPLTYKY